MVNESFMKSFSYFVVAKLEKNPNSSVDHLLTFKTTDIIAYKKVKKPQALTVYSQKRSPTPAKGNYQVKSVLLSFQPYIQYTVKFEDSPRTIVLHITLNMTARL